MRALEAIWQVRSMFLTHHMAERGGRRLTTPGQPGFSRSQALLVTDWHSEINELHNVMDGITLFTRSLCSVNQHLEQPLKLANVPLASLHLKLGAIYPRNKILSPTLKTFKRPVKLT